MKKLSVIAIALGVLAGCQTSVPEAKIEAYKRWYQTRAQILYGIGREHYKAGQLDRAGKKLQEALALDEDHAACRLLLAKVYIEQGHYAVAAAELERVRKHFCRNPEVIYLLGVTQEKQGHLKEALATYRRAHALKTSDLAPAVAAAEVLVGLGRFREAQLYIESYLSLAQNDAGAFELAGRLAMMTEDYEKAASHYERAQDLATENTHYQHELARAYFYVGKYQEALKRLKALVKAEGDKTPVWVYTLLGDSYLSLGWLGNARNAYRSAIEREPTDAGLWANLAKAALALREESRAILAARESLRLDETRLDAVLVLGYALLRNRQARQAVDVLEQAVQGHPESVTLRCLLGRSYTAAGQTAKARRCYFAAVRLEPENPLARELLAQASIRRLSETNDYPGAGQKRRP